MGQPGARGRFERGLRQALGREYQQIRLSRPRDNQERSFSPASAEMVAAEIMPLVEDGFVKLTVVQPDGSRLVLDARHGGSKTLPAPPPAQGPLSTPVLRAIGIANADGSISAQNAKKLKQARHLVEVLRPAVERVQATTDGPLRVLDLACGNAYLSFILADTLGEAQRPFRIHGVEQRAELVATCQQRANTLGFTSMTFSQGRIADASALSETLGGTPHIVVALHACDTATDEALAAAIGLGARAMFVAPCCQAELAAQLRAKKAGPTPGIVHHGLLLREYGALLTDALRAEILDASGYDVDVVEFTDPEHTPKNKLLRATLRQASAPKAGRTPADVRLRCEQHGVAPRLLDLLGA